MGEVQKKFDKEVVSSASAMADRDIITHHTGSLMLDLAIGNRLRAGIPEGRFMEIYGAESSGKTSVALLMIAARQAEEAEKAANDPDYQERMCVFVDAEHSLDLVLAMEYGVDLDKLILINPEVAEVAMDVLDAFIRSGEVGLAVVDSVPALVPASIEQASFQQQHMGTLARFMANVCQKLTGPAFMNKTTVLFINQIREQIGRWSPTGVATTTPGGRALKYYSTIRFEIKRAESIKDSSGIVGHQIKIRTVKNKIGTPFKEAYVNLVYGQGIDRADELLQIGIKSGIIRRGGAWYTCVDEETGEILSFDGEQMRTQGKDKMLENVRSIPSFFEYLENKIRGVKVELDDIDEALLEDYKEAAKEG